ncbi:hypothetical protein Taro_005169, partial [Colocasia esculenta]|nr:hypothetical protein [Colocasia esculenta]
SCGGAVERPHKLIFFPFSSAATCTNRPLEGDQSTLCQYKAVLDCNPRTCPFPVGVWRTPYECDSPIGRILRSCRDSKPRRILNATQRSVATLLPDLTAPSRSSHHPVAFWFQPVATLTREPSQLSHSTAMARNQWQAMQDTVAGLTQALQNVVQDGNQAATARNGVGDLHRNFRSLNPPRFSGSLTQMRQRIGKRR